MRVAYAVLILYLSGLMFVSSTAQANWLNDKQAIMGTKVSVTLWHDNKEKGQSAVDAVMQEMHRIDATLSPYKEQSELSQVNQNAAAAPLKISQELVYLLDKSSYFGELSHGAFDITFASVGRYYDYREKQKPSDSERKALLEAINYQHIKLDQKASTVFFKHPQVYIDLGGIAKGYAVDRGIEILKSHGIQHAAVSAGGDSRVIGDRRGRPWIIGVKNPRQKPGESETIIKMPLQDTAVSTSGDYERFFIDDKSSERVHHILNPKTGKSAAGVVSVTVLGNRGVDTDPLSTTVFVLGVEKGLALINQLPEFDCVIIDRFGKGHYSNGLVDPAVN